MLTRLLAGLVLAALVTNTPAQAADSYDQVQAVPAEVPGGALVQFALGGPMPHAARNAYLTGTLDGGDGEDLPRVTNTLRLPLADRAKPFFEPRPQMLLSASYELDRIGGMIVSLAGLVGVGTDSAMHEPQAAIGIASLRFSF